MIEENNKYIQTSDTKKSLRKYLLSKKVVWYWLIFMVAIVGMAIVFIVPADVYPLVYLRLIFGIAFVSFLPGFAFIKALFPADIPLRVGNEGMGVLDKIVLSLALSFILTSFVGLVLNYTPWGITLIPMSISLFLLTQILALLAIIRDYQALKT